MKGAPTPHPLSVSNSKSRIGRPLPLLDTGDNFEGYGIDGNYPFYITTG